MSALLTSKSQFARVRFSCVLVVFVLLGCADVAFGQDATHPKFSEKDFRSMALEQPRPTYPADAIAARKTGLSVAVVRTDEHGSVSNVIVLEAPSESIKSAMETALNRWRFEVARINDKPSAYMGKVSFYFLIQADKALVLSPDEVPYVGKWRQSREGRSRNRE